MVNYKPASDEIDLLVKRHGLNLSESVMLGDAKYDIRIGKMLAARPAPELGAPLTRPA